MSKSKTFFSFSFGCRVNQAEKELLDQQLISLGFTYSVDNPSIYIINTCAVTSKAEREARQHIYQIRRRFPKTRIIVTGCAATRWIRDRVDVEGVNHLFDNFNKEYLAMLINSNLKVHLPAISFRRRQVQAGISKPQLQTKNLDVAVKLKVSILEPDLSPFICRKTDQGTNWPKTTRSDKTIRVEKFDTKTLSLTGNKYLKSGRMFLKIQDGCQRFCTYCIVPYLRGKPRSVRIKNIVLRIKKYENEIKEVILTAINTEAYGYDTGEKLDDLIRRILQKTNISRLSFGSIHPWSIDNEFFKLYRKLSTDHRFSDFFHIPIQSGSDKILSLMRRNYTSKEILEKLQEIKKINPLAFIGTDIITGFLGETDKDFEDTYKFLEKTPIDRFHIFRFSKRTGTAAYFMAKKMEEPTAKTKEERAKALIALGKRKYEKFLAIHLGKTFPALFLEKRDNNFQKVLLYNQIPVWLQNKGVPTGEIRNVSINKLTSRGLVGSVSKRH